MATKKTTKHSAQTEKPTGEQANPEPTPRKVNDLSIGDIVVIPGFDGPRTICDAARVKDGADAGKFDVSLRDEAGEIETARRPSFASFRTRRLCRCLVPEVFAHHVGRPDV